MPTLGSPKWKWPTQSDHRHGIGRKHWGAPLAAVALALLSAGCRDIPSTPRTGEAVAGRPAADASCDPNLSAACPCDPNAIIGGCSDPGPNPGDTQLSADITLSTAVNVTTATPIYDPATGQSTTNIQGSPPDVHVHIDAGYTALGAVTVNTQFTDGADQSTNPVPQTVVANLTSDNLTEINSSSQQLTDTPPPELDAASPMQLVGSTQNGDITAGVLADQRDTIPVSAARLAPTGPVADRVALARASTERLDFARAITQVERGGVQTARLHGVPVTLRLAEPNRLVVTDADVVTAATVRAGLRTSGTRGTAAGQATSARADKPSTGGVKHTRTFANVDVDDDGDSFDAKKPTHPHTSGRKLWVLQEDRAEADDDDGTRKVHHAHVMRFTHVRWHRNAARDAARRAARPTGEWIPLAGTGAAPGSGTGATEAAPGLVYSRASGPSATGAPSDLRASSGTPHFMVACDNSCTGGAVPPAPAPIGTNPACAPEVQAHINTSGATVNLLFQHGFISDATTWCDGSAYLRTRFVVGNEVRHSLGAGDYYESQAAQLEQRLGQDVQAGYAGPYVFVGHSNGGLVSRFAAQDLGGNPSLVRGVVTVSSPHAGAPLTNLPKATLVALVAVPAVSKLSCLVVHTFLCNQDNFAIAEGGISLLTALEFFETAQKPVLTEMTPHNSFHGFINSRGDPVLHAAVVNQAWERWTMWRLIGDRKYCGQGQLGPIAPNCGDLGRNYVNATDKAYHRYIKCAVVGGILGFVLPGGHAVAAACGLNAAGMRGVDWVYHRVSVGSDQGDGIVPVNSQKYPDGSIPYTAYDSDSHIAETHSQNRTGPQIANALRLRIGVPTAR